MKKNRLFLLLLMAVMLPLAMQAQCDEPLTIQSGEPFEENFDSYSASSYGATGVMPTCWDAIAAGTYGPHVYSGSYGPNGSSDNALVLTSGTSDNYGSPNYAVLPEFTNDLNGYVMTLKTKMESSSYTLTYGYITGTDASTYQQIAVIPSSTSAQSHEITLPSIPAGTRLAFCYACTGIYFCCCIDDVVISAPAACPKPTGLAESNVTTTSATLTWDAGTASGWTLEYSTSSDFTDATSETVTGTPSITINTLTAQTRYYVRVKANCGTDGESEWCNAINFTTPCDAFVVDADHDFFEGFEGTTFEPDCWDRIAAGTYNWSRSTYTVHQGSGSAYSGYYGDIYLVMPALQIANGTTDVWLKFYSNNTYPSDYDKNSVVLLNGDTETELWSPESVSNSWTEAAVNLSEYKGQTIRLAFKYEGSNAHGWYLDDITVAFDPTCMKPSDVALVDGTLTAHSAKISWTDNTENPLGYILLVNDQEVAADENPFTLDLTPETQYTVRVKAVCTTEDTSDLSTDYATFTTPPTCPAPTSLTYSNLTATSVTLDWTNGGNEEQWILVLNGQEIEVNTKPLTIDTLTEQTPYTAILRAFCDANDTSANSNTARFVTKCGATVVTNNLPFEEDFNSITTGIPQCWDNSEGTTTNSSYKWSYYATGKTGHCVRFDSYNNSSNNTNMLKTPTLDLTQVTDPKLSFSYMYPGYNNNSTVGNFSVFVSTDGGNTYTSNIVLNSGHVTDWTDTTIALGNLDSYDQVVIVFQGTSDCGYSDDRIYLDDVFVGGTPSCVAPNEVSVPDSTITTTTAIVHWTDNNENDPANGWTIDVNGTEVAATTNPFTLTGLTPSSAYTVKVKANCSDEDASAWSSTITFATECATITTLPWLNDFEDFTENTVPVCWDNSASTSTTLTNNPERIWGVYSYNDSKMLRMYNYYVQTGIALINTPAITLPTEDVYALSFKYSHLASCDAFSVKISNDGGNTFVEKGSFSATSTSYSYTNPGTFTSVLPISLAEYAGETIIVQFYANANYGSGAIFIDDVNIDVAPTCFNPSALHLDTVTATTATLSWTDNNETAPEGWTISLVAGENEIVVPTSSNPATVENLDPETTYVVKVKANCGTESESDWSNVVNFTTTPTCPAPTNLTYSNLTATSVTLDWTANGEETQWILVLNGQEIEVNTKPLTIDTLTEQTPYTAILRAFCAADDTSYNSNTARFVTPCAPQTAEGYTEDFSGYTASNSATTFSVMPDCWNYIYTGSSTGARPHVYAGTLSPTANDTSLILTAGSSNYGGYAYAIMPAFDDLTGKQVVFATAMENTNYGVLSFGYVTDVNDASTFTSLETFESNAYDDVNRYTTHEVVVNGVPANARLAFQWHNTYIYYSCCIDDIAIEDMPACVKPINVTAADSTITATSAIIAWTDNNETTPEYGWTINLNGVDTTVTENPFTFDNLSGSTLYTVKVKANCSEEDASDWSTAIAFRTSCTNIVNLPWRENFEDFTVGTVPDCWDNSASTSSTLDANPERIWGVYSYNNNQMLRMYNYLVQTGVALINSPAITLPVEGSYELIFKYSHLASCGEFSVKISNDGGNTFVEKGTYTANTTSYSYTNPGTFTEIEPISLAEYAGQSIIVQFYANANFGSGAIFVDDISIATPPTCLKPIEVTISDITTTSATIAWTDNNTTAPQSWVIELNGTEYDADTNPYTIETLTDATSYTVKVKAICTDDDESDWSDEVTFSTACGTIVVTEENPYNEGFEGADFGCWSTQVLSGTLDWLLTNQEAAVGTQSAGFSYSGDSSYLISPVFDLTQVSNVQLSFQHMQPEWTGDPASELYVYYRTSETEEWNQIAAYTTFFEDFTLETLTLPNTSATYQVCFKGVGAEGYNVFLDDVTISGEEPVEEPCETPTNVAYENGVVTWTGDAANYNVHIVAGETVIDTTVSTTSYTIEGLNEGDHATVTVQAVCSETETSDWSEAVEFDYTVGINNYAIRANIYPNPTTGNVTVESNAINADITVFDMFGKLMMTSKVAAERTELNFSTFAPGVYMIRIANSNAITTIKVVKE